MIGQYFFVGGIAGVVISLLLLLIFKGVFKKEEKRLMEKKSSVGNLVRLSGTGRKENGFCYILYRQIHRSI